MTFSAPTAPLADQIAAALDWWREAGVDQDFDDAARDWLAGKAPAATGEPVAAPPTRFRPVDPPPAPAISFGGERADWPDSFDKFATWWLSEPSLDAGQVFNRVAPRGPQHAELMVMVDYPEASDSERLLSSDQGKLVSAILSAIGIDPAGAYFASLLPRHMPLPDWSALAAAGLREVSLHHIELAAPKRLISFGANASSLLGHDPANSADLSRQFYHVGPSIPALAAPGLETLMARPKGKAALWRDLLNWQAI